MVDAAAPLRESDARTSVRRPLFVLGALTLVLELLIVLCPGPHLSERWVLAEELHKGNIAHEVLAGPVLPLLDYHHVPNAGGTLVVGLGAVPFFAVLGETLLAVRLVPILFDLATVLFFVLVLERLAGRRAAWIGGTLLAIATPGYALIAVTSEGSHTENNAPTFACVLLWLLLRTDAAGPASRAPRRLGIAFALGVVAGFALYFGYMVAIALAALAVVEFACDRRCFLRPSFAAFVPGLLLGLAPWFAYNARNGFEGTKLYGASPERLFEVSRVLSGAWARVASLVAAYLPDSFFFVDVPHLPRTLLDWTYYVGLLALVVLGVRRVVARARAARREAGTWSAACARVPELVLVAYLPLFVVAYALVDVYQAWMSIDIAHDGRYVTPLYPFLVALAALGADAAWSSPFARGSVRVLAAVGVVGVLAVCDFRRAGEGAALPGTSREEFARWIAWRYKTDERRMDLVVDGLVRRGDRDELEGVVFTVAELLRWRLRRVDRGDSFRSGARAELADALDHLRARVPEHARDLCDPPAEGDRAYRYDERAIYREDREARRLGRPVEGAAEPGAK